MIDRTAIFAKLLTMYCRQKPCKEANFLNVSSFKFCENFQLSQWILDSVVVSIPACVSPGSSKVEQTKNHYNLVSVLDMLMILVPSILVDPEE